MYYEYTTTLLDRQLTYRQIAVWEIGEQPMWEMSVDRAAIDRLLEKPLLQRCIAWVDTSPDHQQTEVVFHLNHRWQAPLVRLLLRNMPFFGE